MGKNRDNCNSIIDKIYFKKENKRPFLWAWSPREIWTLPAYSSSFITLPISVHSAPSAHRSLLVLKHSKALSTLEALR